MFCPALVMKKLMIHARSGKRKIETRKFSYLRYPNRGIKAGFLWILPRESPSTYVAKNKSRSIRFHRGYREDPPSSVLKSTPYPNEQWEKM